MVKGARATAAVILALAGTAAHAAERMDSYEIGAHGQANVRHPAWFKDSFLDLRDDLAEARVAGKRGIIVFFSQRSCSHCQAFVDTTLSDPATRDRVRRGFDVIGLDIFNDLAVTGVDGMATSIRDFAQAQGARFTPTLVFYSTDGRQLARLVGFYPPEKFSRVLDFVEGGHNARETLAAYLRRTRPAPATAPRSLTVDYTLFETPPHRLQPGTGRPLVVVFDQADCDACARFRARVLADPEVRALLGQFRAVMLDRVDDRSTVVDPAGRETSPAQWAQALGLAYEPSVLFFDKDGVEVHRIDSEAGKDRVTGSLQYVLEGAYREHDQFLRWRREKARAAGTVN